MTLGSRLPQTDNGPYEHLEKEEGNIDHKAKLEQIHSEITSSLNKHRFKEALRSGMKAAQYGNQIIQSAAPWKFLSPDAQITNEGKESLATLSFGWRICRFLSIVMQPFMPFSSLSQRLWNNLGQVGDVSDVDWSEAINWDAPMTWNSDKAEPLLTVGFVEILEHEESLVSDVSDDARQIYSVKRTGKREEKKKMSKSRGALNIQNLMTL